MITLTPQNNDNPNFMLNLEKIILNRLEKWHPQNFFLTRIDNWFDDKWLKFSGTIVHEISIWRLEDVTIPPFHPNRVEACQFYQKTEGQYQEQALTKPLHIFQASADNLRRKIADFSNDGLFMWYSANSLTNQQGSLMSYWVKDGECFCFYVSLSGEKDWNALRTNGISVAEAQAMIKSPVRQ